MYLTLEGQLSEEQNFTKQVLEKHQVETSIAYKKYRRHDDFTKYLEYWLRVRKQITLKEYDALCARLSHSEDEIQKIFAEVLQGTKEEIDSVRSIIAWER